MTSYSSNRGSAHEVASLVLPAYNPGKMIEQTWEQLRAFVRESPDSWEILFVCDGCTDGTPELLQRLTYKDTLNVKVLSYSKNRGKGYAVRYGLSAATGDYRIFTDCDLAYRFEAIEKVAAALRHGAEVAIASRSHPDSELVLSRCQLGYIHRRQIQGQVFNALVRCVLPISQGDTQAGLKGMTAAAATRILPYLYIDGFGFDCELLTACNHFHIPVTETPIRVHYDATPSTVKAQTTLKMVQELFRIRRLWRNGPPAPQFLPSHELARAG